MPRVATRSRRQREKEDRRERILNAARDAFFEEGLRHATVDSIAQRAEVAKGTVYLYFRTKETIIAHLLLEGLDDLGQRLETAYDESAPRSAEDRLRRLGCAYFNFCQEEPDYFRLMMAFDRGHFQESVSPDVYGLILHRSMRGLHWVVRAIEHGIAQHEFAPNDPKYIAGMFWAALNGVLVLTGHPLRRELIAQEMERLYQGVMNTLLAGLKQPVVEPLRQ
jgi:AcrR family transcriptional regulator